MESIRDINKVVEKEIGTRGCPLKLDYIEFGEWVVRKFREILIYK